MIDINNLSKYEENNRIEVKKAKGGLPNSLWETYSAFANTDGGIILLGVDEKEDHTLVVTGVEDVHKMKADFWNVINNKQKISLNILTERMVSSKTIEGKAILCVEVPKADRRHRPIYVGNDPFLLQGLSLYHSRPSRSIRNEGYGQARRHAITSCPKRSAFELNSSC